MSAEARALEAPGMRIFLDASILFFAAKPDGAMRRLLALLIDVGRGYPPRM